MVSLLVTYDLRQPGQDYQSVYDYLGGYTSKPILESVWIIVTQKSAAQVRDDLKALVDTNDRLFVTHFSSWAGLNASGDWINEHCQ